MAFSAAVLALLLVGVASTALRGPDESYSAQIAEVHDFMEAASGHKPGAEAAPAVVAKPAGEDVADTLLQRANAITQGDEALHGTGDAFEVEVPPHEETAAEKDAASHFFEEHGMNQLAFLLGHGGVRKVEFTASPSAPAAEVAASDEDGDSDEDPKTRNRFAAIDALRRRGRPAALIG
eukprot:NODE_4358_length_682_cov_210.797448.p2 GENE.NODE_4358_length_682_cov_210.797448~~NODE_4358_length_682_cov_210.797448.p2  ORF type:complete len:179 (-),score=57.54 NODE_4358_length_682_cov_210.797448:39-575(-)